MSKLVTISQPEDDPTSVTVDLSAQCFIRFKCSTIAIAEDLCKRLQASDIVMSVNLEFPGVPF